MLNFRTHPCRTPMGAGLGGAARERLVRIMLDLPGAAHVTIRYSIADLVPYRISKSHAKGA
jgi:hypothetical protein